MVGTKSGRTHRNAKRHVGMRHTCKLQGDGRKTGARGYMESRGATVHGWEARVECMGGELLCEGPLVPESVPFAVGTCCICARAPNVGMIVAMEGMWERGNGSYVNYVSLHSQAGSCIPEVESLYITVYDSALTIA